MERRQIPYYYDGIMKPLETDLDVDGLMSIPSEGEVLVRPGGRRWKVVEVIAKHDHRSTLLVYMVHMTESI
jgi:hypothetical protein